MRVSRTFVAAALLALAGAGRAAAQTSGQRVVGHIVDRATSAPIQGAFVQLVDSTGTVRAAVLSDPAGRFILETPVPGRYTLRAERIGYANAVSDTLVVGAGETLAYRFAVRVQAISLEGLKVTTAKGRCRLSQQAGTATSTLWNEARKALEVAVWLEKQRGVPFQDVLWNRTRDLISLELEQGDRRVASGFDKKPFRSATAQELEQGGFVQPAPHHTIVYFGLDAQALLSDAFLRGHCIHAVTPHGNENRGLVGLSFKPVDPHGLPDIEGTVWLDRKTSELRYVEFEYTRHLFSLEGVPKSFFGGRLDFERLANGAWVVEKWWLRMPSWGNSLRQASPGAMTPFQSPLARAMQDGLRIRETGGQVAFMPRLASSADTGTAAVDGTVWDSVNARPLAGATVFLADDYTRAAKTDMLGRFHLSGLPAGRHILAFFAPFTDSLDLPPLTHLVSLQADRRTEVALAIPEAAGCRPSPSSSAIVGFVESTADGTPLAGVPVRAVWRIPAGSPPGGKATVADTTDVRGRYLLCGIPLGHPVKVTVPHERAMSLLVTSSGPIRQDLLEKAPGS